MKKKYKKYIHNLVIISEKNLKIGSNNLLVKPVIFNQASIILNFRFKIHFFDFLVFIYYIKHFF